MNPCIEEQNRGFAETFGHAADEHDQNQCVSLAHTLKGSAANIGAIALADAASSLEAESRQNADDCKAILGHLMTQLDLVFSEIARFLAQHAEQAEPGSPAGVRQADGAPELDFSHLATLIRNCDAGSIEECESLLARVSEEKSRAALMQIRAAVEQFDFDSAGSLLDSLKAALP